MLQQHRTGLHKTITISVGICLTNGETVGLDYERRDKTGKTPPVQAWSFLIGGRLHRPHKYTKPGQNPACRQVPSVITMDLKLK